jgi:hypothetical protein
LFGKVSSGLGMMRKSLMSILKPKEGVSFPNEIFFLTNKQGNFKKKERFFHMIKNLHW